ncbi:MAG: vitamin K-dependent gamma-carboxylase, partial [Myxococcota bacterium]
MRAWLSQPIDAAGLAWARASFGLVIAWEAARYASMGRIDAYYIEPTYTFPYYGFSWLTPLEGMGMYVVFGALFASGIGVALGLLYRLAAPVLFVSLSYIFLLDEAQYLNHLYLCCLLALLLCVVPAHRTLSLDARLGLARPSESVPAWSLWILRLQVGLVYFWGGIAKINGDWLQAMPLLDWMEGRRGFWLVGPLLAWDPTAWMMSYSGLLLDLFLFPALLWRRSRTVAITLAIVFHVLNASIFTIGIFPYLMIAWTLLFLEPDWPRRFLPAARSLPTTPLLPRWGLAVMGLWFAVQFMLPLRHWLYPGEVSWTEEGHRFSWRMKLRSKQSRATFIVRDVDTGQQWKVNPADLLTERQVRKMSTRPDMILLFAHHIEDELRARGHGDVEVRARVFAS